MKYFVVLFTLIVAINAASYQVIPAVNYEGDIYVPLSLTSLRVVRSADARGYHGGGSEADASAASQGFNGGFGSLFGPSNFGNFGKGNLGHPGGTATAGARAGSSGGGNSDSVANAQTQTFQGNGFTGSASSASASSHSSGGGHGSGSNAEASAQSVS